MSTPDQPPNGTTEHSDNNDAPKNSEERIAQLEEELEKTKAESDNWAEQYRTLLAKLTTMRTTLANKLQQDAEELDRREQHITQLTSTNDELSNTIEALKQELTAASDDASNLSRELSALRQRTLDTTSSADAELEQTRLELEQTRGDLDATRRELEIERMEREDIERESAQERVMSEEVRMQVGVLRREVEQAASLRAKDLEALEREKEKSSNLQSVLEDFQLAKEMEIKQALSESESSLQHTIKQLAEFKSRALQAEAELAESTHSSDRVVALEKEVKEKNLLIGKLRHEAVIINEHLTIALRRLRSSTASSTTSVDKALVSNILLSFLSAPRADGTRFEMLNVLASVLGWGENEREKAGLQRAGSGANAGLGVGIALGGRRASTSGGKDVELDRGDETESFSKMWVEFLMKEANQGSAPSTPTGLGPSAASGFPIVGSPRAASLSLPTISRTASGGASRASPSGQSLAPSFEHTSDVSFVWADSPTTGTSPRLSTSSLTRSSLGLGLNTPRRSDATSPLSRTGDEE